MLGEEIWLFDGAPYVFIGLMIVIDVALIYLNRTFFKKI